MNHTWPDFRNIVRRPYANRVWVPLGISRTTKSGQYPDVGYQLQFEGVHSLAVPLEKRELGDRYSWSDDHEHRPWAAKGYYKTADAQWADDEGELVGIRLALRQTFPDRPNKWHLNQDFIIALGLAFENGVWVRPSEGYDEVARVIVNRDGNECGIEVKAVYLKDYLCARESALRLCTFQDLDIIVKKHCIPENFEEQERCDFAGGKLEIRSMNIDDSGSPAGSTVAVFRVSRNDVDPQDDVPQMGPETSDNTESESWSFTRPDGYKCRLMGDFWRDEWLEPAEFSPRVRWDTVPSEVTFIISADGQRANADDLNDEDIGRWLWFKPEIISAVASRRGAELTWYSRNTGGVSTPSDPSVHFGVNELGLVTVYARDVARLPEWERRLWAGFNVSPDGKVCSELLLSQVEAQPASTLAPEKYLPLILTRLNHTWLNVFGGEILRQHDHFDEIVKRCHRFIAVDRAGLFSLAKDIARITADLIDAKVAQKVVPPPKGENWGSLKSFEMAITTRISPEIAHMLMGPLNATYQLRLSDAHLPKKDVHRAFEILKISDQDPWVVSGFQMLNAVVSSLSACTRILGQSQHQT